MSETPPLQLWIRTESGRVLGPLGPSTLAVLAEDGSFGRRCEASRDGVLFSEPWLFPELREVLPAALLGAVAPADEPEAAEAGPLPELAPRGAIAGGVPFRLYYLAAATGATGALSLAAPDGAGFELFFRKGTPELARSNAPGLDLGSFLENQGLVDAAGLARARAARGSYGGELLNALFALGLLAPNRAFPLVAQHAREVLDRALGLEAGTFRWDADAIPPAAAFPLGGKWDLLCGAGRRLDPATVRRRLGTRVDLPVMRAGDGLVRLEDLRLTAQESRIAAALDGTRSLAALVALNPGETEAILRTACFLADVGLASFAARPRPRAKAPPSVGPPPAARAPDAPATCTPAPARSIPAGSPVRPIPGGAVRPSPGPAARSIPAGPTVRPTPGGAPVPTAPPVLRPVASPAAPPPSRLDEAGLPGDLPGVEAFLAGLAGRNHFEVLGLARTAGPAQIKAAYFRLARAFHPDTAGTGADPELRQAKQDVTARLNGAYQVLSDDARRAEYLGSLAAGAGSTQVDVAGLLAAEESFAWAVVRVKARRFAEALPALEKAIGLNPAEGEFYAWRGWARFAAAADPRAAEAAANADVHRALELSPKCAAAWLFAGRIATALGHATRAAEAYRKCLALDANHLEAQRELRLLEGRGTTK
jgi:hypothetical protein